MTKKLDKIKDGLKGYPLLFYDFSFYNIIFDIKLYDMKKIVIVLLSLFFGGIFNIQAQNNKSDYNTRFNKFIQNRDTLFAKSVLNEWEENSPEDPDLYIAYLNYYFLKSLNQTAYISKEEPKEQVISSLAIKDSLGNISGYIVTKAVYDDNEIAKAVNYIDKGILKYPNRLDMRACKIYILGQSKKWSSYASEIIDLIRHSNTINHQWILEGDKPVTDGEDLFISSIQEYQQQLYSLDTVGDNIRNIAAEMMKYYPKNVENINYMAVSYIKDKDFKSALQYLKKAEKITPKDQMILRNMAIVYKKMGNDKKSKAYIKKMNSELKQNN